VLTWELIKQLSLRFTSDEELIINKLEDMKMEVRDRNLERRQKVVG